MRDHDVWMERPDMRGLARVVVPPGYRLRKYRPGDAATWVAIHRKAEPGCGPSLGMFHAEFPGSDALRARRMIFAVDARGRPVGTVTAWFDAAGPKGKVGRLHWLAVVPAHQGRGLGWVLTAACLRLMKRYHRRAVLETDAGRPEAIRLYLRAGFRPRNNSPAAVRVRARELREP